jgi:sortase A
MRALPRRLLALAEIASWTLGVAGCVWLVTFHVNVARWTQGDLARFEAHRVAAAQAGTPDQSLWSPERVSAWRGAIRAPGPVPMAVLRIPKIRLVVPVLPGTDDWTLDRAVGHIEHTAQPGDGGNLGIAGHRDGFFRGLKDIARGDAIELETPQGIDVYRVERTWVVDPEEVSVLDPTPDPALTLVTCYPFYFVGSAPRRFIVRAVRVGDMAAADGSGMERSPCTRSGRWRCAGTFSSRVLSVSNGAF